MTLLSKVFGKASVAKAEKIDEDYKYIYLEGEKTEIAFKVIRDSVIFTNYRVIFVNYQGVTGKKREYVSIPYESISHFAVETSGHLDFDVDLKIWIKGRGPAFEKKLKRDNDNAYEIIKILTRYTSEAN